MQSLTTRHVCRGAAVTREVIASRLSRRSTEGRGSRRAHDPEECPVQESAEELLFDDDGTGVGIEMSPLPVVEAPRPPSSIGLLLSTRQVVLANETLGSLVATAETAEQVGFGSVWAGESVTAKPRPDLFTLLAACAVRTNRITLGAAAALPALHHPVRFAHQLGTLDQLAGGRLVVGVGAGYPGKNTEAECEAFGVGYATRRGTADAVVEAARALWQSGKGDPARTTEFWDLRDIEIAPRPVNPLGVPFWLGGEGAATKRRCARNYDGWMPTSASPERLSAGVADVRNAAEEVGRDPSAIAISTILTIAVDDDGDRARRQLLDYLQAYYRTSSGLAEITDVVGAFGGTVDQCAERIAAYLAAGAATVIVRFAGDDQFATINELGRPLLEAVAERVGVR